MWRGFEPEMRCPACRKFAEARKLGKTKVVSVSESKRFFDLD